MQTSWVKCFLQEQGREAVLSWKSIFCPRAGKCLYQMAWGRTSDGRLVFRPGRYQEATICQALFSEYNIEDVFACFAPNQFAYCVTMDFGKVPPWQACQFQEVKRCTRILLLFLATGFLWKTEVAQIWLGLSRSWKMQAESSRSQHHFFFFLSISDSCVIIKKIK